MSAATTCEICKANVSKYKCPVCLIKFCCVSCFKTHKDSGPCVKPEIIIEEKGTEVKDINYEFETEDTVPTEKLKLLSRDKFVRKDLENKYLREIIQSLCVSKDPYVSVEQAMQEPIFAEFVTHCLDVVEDKQTT
ncbi:zinc finger HIT domain-containing protein 3-like [Uloborus diversus]|uniref:zinc finger HIT domain-containing protein 3-like n=1 Tax=Uloborus diversus TaxID=327109 RepID=UPI00240A387F|nr:zinc finger HIT domain-containing protein 3-like [Uloborus diversus]XP_054717927.1 zinc finger HIT domain-containing protein 3-like [Uloborus diversus]